MNLEPRINDEIKAATKSGDRLRLETMRSIRAAIIEFNKSGIGRAMNDEDELKILKNQAKKRKDAIEMYEKGNRPELLEKESKELEIIESFLPKMLGEDEIIVLIKDIIGKMEENEAKNLGKVMGASMKELKGKADGAVVQKVVKEILG